MSDIVDKFNNINGLIKEAIRSHSSEITAIEVVADNRYNNSKYSNYGEYDWFSGIALYCLIRYIKPKKILEVSTGCGFASSYMALALKKNGEGVLHTYEIIPELCDSAKSVFDWLEVSDYVNLYLGDAQKLIETTEGLNYDILFLDSLHAAHFTKWFVKKIIMNNSNNNALVHFHDVMPESASVRMWGGPPVEGTRLDQLPSVYARGKQLIKKMLGIPTITTTEYVPLNIKPASKNMKLQTFDGNQTSESVYVNSLLKQIDTQDYCYLHEEVSDYLDLNPRKYDKYVIGREDYDGKPFEWNEAVWTFVHSIKKCKKY